LLKDPRFFKQNTVSSSTSNCCCFELMSQKWESFCFQSKKNMRKLSWKKKGFRGVAVAKFEK